MAVKIPEFQTHSLLTQKSSSYMQFMYLQL